MREVSKSKKPGNSKSNRKKGGFIPRIVVLIFVVYFSFLLVSLQLEIENRKREITSLSAQIETMSIKKDEYQALIDQEIDEEYIIRTARNQLGMALPGERIFIDTSKR